MARLLEDSRRFVDEWNVQCGPKENLKMFRSSNVLGKRSRSRAEDALAILRQRFVQPGPEVIRDSQGMTASPDAFRAACYYEAARKDDLLAYTAGEILYASRRRGWIRVGVEDMERALLEAPLGPAVKEWGESTSSSSDSWPTFSAP